MPLSSAANRFLDVDMGYVFATPNLYDFADKKNNPVLTKQELDTLRALDGYSLREGVLGKIAAIIYRIWNAIKAVFRQSDWQKANRVLETLYTRLLNHKVTSLRADIENLQIAFAIGRMILGTKEGRINILEQIVKFCEKDKGQQASIINKFSTLFFGKYIKGGAKDYFKEYCAVSS